uniref:Rhomboid domain-containing protein n=1 Tax=Panagrellus redivivus TaxID=6233 RepID=A0A7E4WDC3_PANRE
MSEQVFHPFPDNLPFADGYGYIYSILGVTFALLHWRLASVIFWYNEYWKNPCYKIIAVICTSEVWQNLIHAFTGFVMLLKPSESTVFEIIIGSLGHGGGIGMIILDFILALNRLDVFKPPNFPIRFGPKRIYALVGIACLIAATFMAILMTPLCDKLLALSVINLRFRTCGFIYTVVPAAIPRSVLQVLSYIHHQR